jgi:hypothetical protein
MIWEGVTFQLEITAVSTFCPNNQDSRPGGHLAPTFRLRINHHFYQDPGPESHLPHIFQLGVIAVPQICLQGVLFGDPTIVLHDAKDLGISLDNLQMEVWGLGFRV